MDTMEEPISSDEAIAVSEHIEDSENATPTVNEASVEPPSEPKETETMVEAPSETPQLEPPTPEVTSSEKDDNKSSKEEQKEAEVLQNNAVETPELAVTKVLSATQVEEMFEFNERKDEERDQSPSNEEELYDLNPQVNIEDMKVVSDEVREVDILVCGSCHTVVHFVEEFNKHKSLCKKKSDFHGNIAETKPQVWAFLLWKNAQTKMYKRGAHIEESSWKLYQKWCKMPERIRNAWVAAGETVMNFSTFGYAKPTDSSAKPLPLKRPEREELEESDENKPVILRKLVQRDASGEIKEIKSTTGIKKTVKTVIRMSDDIENIRNQLEDGDNFQDKEINPAGPTDTDTPRVGFTKVHRVKGKDGAEDTLQEEEFVVEKIVSRRFNPRKKQYEYLLKWEGYPSEQNTWEPAENLEACQHLLKAFEENLAKQSLNKQKTGYNKQKAENVQPTTSTFSHGGRPIRYSKQKALSQVKQWCGSIKPDDAELELIKKNMPATDSDEEEPFAKKIRLDRETDSEDSLGGSKVFYSKSGKSGIIRRPGRPPLKPKITNGTTESLAAVLGLDSGGEEKNPAIDAINRGIVKKSTGLSPHNQQVLVANAKGVVKVDPSQVPNLSSGVYIMSNKSGIIKLDSVSPSKALSLKGVAQPSSVKQMSMPAPSAPLANNTAGVTATSQSGVIMVNRENQGPAKSGIMRRPGIPPRRGVGRPPTRTNNVRVANPNTRLIHSGSRSNVAITPGIRPRPPLKPGLNDLQNRVEGERRILGPKIGRGGIQRGGIVRPARGGITPTVEKTKDLDPDNVFIDLPQESSSDSDPGLPDLFPTDLPPLEPESPPRPLTLCPETGKVLLKAEGEKTPEPTPPQSPKPAASLETPPSETAVNIKEEPSGSHQIQTSTGSYITKIGSNISNAGKETLVKKTLKPGSIGSMSVSPKKSFTDDSDELVTITGDDGMVYNVRKSELNNGIIVSDDGPQCVYVTTNEEGEENTTVLALDPSSYADTVAQLGHVNILGGDNETQFIVKEGDEGGELVSVQSIGQEEGGDDGQSQVVAQLVEAGEPTPGGGPRRVVLLLPDGNLMVTEVDEEQYAALELDKCSGGIE